MGRAGRLHHPVIEVTAYLGQLGGGGRVVGQDAEQPAHGLGLQIRQTRVLGQPSGARRVPIAHLGAHIQRVGGQGVAHLVAVPARVMGLDLTQVAQRVRGHLFRYLEALLPGPRQRMGRVDAMEGPGLSPPSPDRKAAVRVLHAL